MFSLREVREKLSSIQCPYCDGYPLELAVQKNKAGETSYMANCQGCACTFTIPLDTKKLIEADPTLEGKLSKTLCPMCHRVGVVLEFRCDTQKNECFYVMTCKDKDCGCVIREFR